MELSSPKNTKDFLYFGKWNFLATSLKLFLYFRRELAKPEKKYYFISFHIFYLLRDSFSKINAKEKSFQYFLL